MPNDVGGTYLTLHEKDRITIQALMQRVATVGPFWGEPHHSYSSSTA